MLKAAFSTPFCEEMLSASCTMVPGEGRGGHCAIAPANETPQMMSAKIDLQNTRMNAPFNLFGSFG
jgi:hypothetical protein